MFIDTAGKNFNEASQGGEKSDESFANFDEAFVVEQLVRKYISLGVKAKDIGVITPYWAQVIIHFLYDASDGCQPEALTKFISFSYHH